MGSFWRRGGPIVSTIALCWYNRPATYSATWARFTVRILTRCIMHICVLNHSRTPLLQTSCATNVVFCHLVQFWIQKHSLHLRVWNLGLTVVALLPSYCCGCACILTTISLFLCTWTWLYKSLWYTHTVTIWPFGEFGFLASKVMVVCNCFSKCVRPVRHAGGIVSVVHLDTVIVNVGVIIEGLVNIAVGWWQRILIVAIVPSLATTTTKAWTSCVSYCARQKNIRVVLVKYSYYIQ